MREHGASGGDSGDVESGLKEQTKPQHGLQFTVVSGIVLNVLSTVGVVWANKYLWKNLEFRYMVVLSCFHFVFTGVVIRMLVWTGVVPYKAAPLRGVLPVALGSLGSIVFNNLSLAYNSVGFYQTAKLVCIPCTLVMEYYMFGKTVTRNVKLSLLVILLGVALAEITDMEVNVVGSVFAGLAVACTVLGQIFTNSKQSELGLDALQLLYHVSPVISLGMLLMAPFFDELYGGPKALNNYEFTTVSIGMIVLACALALGVNVSNYMVIGKAGAVTYQVVGHLKSCLILILGFAFFGYAPNYRNTLGIVIAMIGMIVYSELKRQNR